MTEEEFRSLANAHLDRRDEADEEAIARTQPTAEMFADLYRRWQASRIAFPGMSWEEFGAIDAARERKGRRGRPRRSVDERAGEPLWKAARDADRIKALWRTLCPSRPRPSPPIHPHDIAAERHGVSRQSLDDRIKRPNTRRMDRKAAE